MSKNAVLKKFPNSQRTLLSNEHGKEHVDGYRDHVVGGGDQRARGDGGVDAQASEGEGKSQTQDTSH